MFYILGKTEDPDCTNYDFPHHGYISLGYPNTEYYLVAKSPGKHLITSNHSQYGNGNYTNNDKYYVLFPWSLFLIRIVKRSNFDFATIITMNFAKESLIENLNTEVYYSYMPNAFYGHKNEYLSLPNGMSVLCGVGAELNNELDIENKIALTLNAIFDSNFRTAFDYDYHDNPMFIKHVENAQKPKYYEDQGYPQKEDHDEEYEEYDEDSDEPYSESLNPIGLYEYLENVSLEDLVKEDWGSYSNPLSFYVEYFKIKLNDQYFSKKKELLNATN